MKRRILLVLPLIFAVSALGAAERMTIAILNVESSELPSLITNAVSEIIRAEFTNYGNFIVVERAKLDSIIEEQKLSLSGLLDESTAAEIGALAAAQKILLGELNPVGSEYLLTLRIVDVATGQAEFSSRGSAGIDALDTAAAKVSRELAQKIVSGYKEYFTALSPGGYYLRSLVPGLGQFYADKNVEGAIFLGLNITALGFVATGGILYLKASGDYHNLALGAEQGVIDEAFEKWVWARDFVNYSLISLGGAYLLHWIDVLLFARPKFKDRAEDGPAKAVILPAAAVRTGAFLPGFTVSVKW